MWIFPQTLLYFITKSIANRFRPEILCWIGYSPSVYTTCMRHYNSNVCHEYIIWWIGIKSIFSPVRSFYSFVFFQ